MNLMQLQSNGKISSKILYEFVCIARVRHGESQPRLNDFHARVIDELDGEHYENFVVTNPNKTETIFYSLTPEQCMLVGMRESKAVRRDVLEKIKQLTAKEFYIPQTYGEALQLCADQAKQLELAAPKVAFVDKLVERHTLMTSTQVAQKHGKSAVWLNKFLEEVGVFNRSVKRCRAFQQWFIDKGYGEMKQTEQGHSQALFSTAGELWISEKLISESAI